MYVQDLLREDSDQLLPMLLGDKACFYICGSTKMAKSVHTALLQILTGNTGKTSSSIDASSLLSETEADILLSDLKDGGRYVQEFW